MSAPDRSVRRLTALDKSSSTSRVLNLRATVIRNPILSEGVTKKFFDSRFLNSSIILKHRLRPNEFEHFQQARTITTKIIFPLDRNDLRVGGQYLMMGQKHFEDQASGALGSALNSGTRDRQVLDLLDELPSLDPFLVREQLRRHGIEPDRAYFNISDADVENMQTFVEKQIESLVQLSTTGTESGTFIKRLAGKMLSGNAEQELGPLREALNMTGEAYLDGIFAWRGFLYFKWSYANAAPAVDRLKAAIRSVRTAYPAREPLNSYLAGARDRLCLALDKATKEIADLLGNYDQSYQALVQNQDPGTFRSFLLAAPDQFMQIGLPLGALQHMLSFWRYRFNPTQPQSVLPDELADLFADVEETMGTRHSAPELFQV